MNKGGRSPYDAKVNMAEIGAVNMGEMGAVRKRSRKETGPHDSSPCVARVKILDRVPSGSLPRRLRSLLLLFPMFQLRSASNGPSV